ncbi:hypothetical protein GLYMA_18G270150v4 [Glycine max]|nr:hypothetical protein GLYMA_18G270150v4 [Glycine max]KAH1156351.1 hypothetical protein GYH30_051243 [Glycine max]
MDTTSTQIASGTILFLLLLFFPYLSIADVIYSPVELFSINCGSNSSLSTHSFLSLPTHLLFPCLHWPKVSSPLLLLNFLPKLPSLQSLFLSQSRPIHPPSGFQRFPPC